jgi:septal ring factor EnvC (AmiA/AmiB activator)
MTGAWTIEPAELHRVYPLADAVIDGSAEPAADALPHHGVAEVEIRELRARLGDAQETIADLRRRLDTTETARQQADAERRQTAERLTALLADQRPTPPAPPPATLRRS